MINKTIFFSALLVVLFSLAFVDRGVIEGESLLVEEISLPDASMLREVEAIQSPEPAPVVKTPIIESQINPDPRRLIIPKIGVDARILGMGLRPDGKMDVPANYVDAGWFNLGARPGEIGSAVMGAHVDDGALVNGIFKNLKDLAIGDEITVMRADGRALRFIVSEIGIYDAEDRDTDHIFFRADKPRLNLITCHGKWLPHLNTYSHRLIVFAELVREFD